MRKHSILAAITFFWLGVCIALFVLYFYLSADTHHGASILFVPWFLWLFVFQILLIKKFQWLDIVRDKFRMGKLFQFFLIYFLFMDLIFIVNKAGSLDNNWIVGLPSDRLWIETEGKDLFYVRIENDPTYYSPFTIRGEILLRDFEECTHLDRVYCKEYTGLLGMRYIKYEYYPCFGDSQLMTKHWTQLAAKFYYNHTGGEIFLISDSAKWIRLDKGPDETTL